MIINKTYSKRPYITPACRVGEMNVWLLISSGEVNGSGMDSGDPRPGGNTRPISVKGFYSSGDKWYQGYENDF